MRTGRLYLLSLFTLFCACVPTAARRNARLEPGFDFDIIAGANTLLPGEDQDGNETQTRGITHLEVDLQWANTYKDRSGVAFQLKVPINVFFTSIDAYYQIPGKHPRWYYGFGAELGIASSLYGIVTYYPSENFYMSLTPRLLTGGRRGEYMLNPQFALGYNGAVDVSAFAGYMAHTGRGINVDVDLFNQDRFDYRTRFALAGVSVRF
jgi:hypothetical protein